MLTTTSRTLDIEIRTYGKTRLYPKVVSSHIKQSIIDIMVQLKAKKSLSGHPRRFLRVLIEDWLFLSVLGIVMALLSLLVDYGADKLFIVQSMLVNRTYEIHNRIYRGFVTSVTWVSYSTTLVMVSAICAHIFAPQTVGSGVPEVKVILQGVALAEHLTLKTLIFKVFGLTLTLGSGLPVGKEGPFVHIGSIVSSLLSRLIKNLQPAYTNEARNCELIAAGCAAGVASTFGAPIGGVLFSIEVTTAYFAIRDYWRGFFAASFGSALYALLRLTRSPEVTVFAVSQTTFVNPAYLPEELVFFAIIGLLCGAIGASFIAVHRKLLLFLKKSGPLKTFFQMNLMIYPLTVSFTYFIITYPHMLGKFLNGKEFFTQALKDFIVNCTWSASKTNRILCDPDLVTRWSATGSIFTQLLIFCATFYFLAVVVSTIPVPAGIFMPAFVIGAGLGRLIGEIVAVIFPDGIRANHEVFVNPGVYAIVGATALCGAITHTVSVAVIAFELTGQLLHTLPVLLAVIVSNSICALIQPSFFDSLIQIKRLPYLPDVPKYTQEVHEIRVEQIMVRKVKSLHFQATYWQLQEFLAIRPRLNALPIINSPEKKILLGSISRHKLLQLLDEQIGERARELEAICRANKNRARKIMISNMHAGAGSNAARMAAIENKFAVTTSDPALRCRKKRSSFNCSDFDGSSNIQSVLKSSRSVDDIDRCAIENATISSGKKKQQFRRIDVCQSIGHAIRHLTSSINWNCKKDSNSILDLSEQERKIWEAERLSCPIMLSSVEIDPAPFQLVEDTSLYKVHSLFSILGLKRAYVTKCGSLVGVVSFKEIINAMQNANSGGLNALTKRAEIPSSDPTNRFNKNSKRFSSLYHSDDSDLNQEDFILPRIEFEQPDAAKLSREIERRLSLANTNIDFARRIHPFQQCQVTKKESDCAIERISFPKLGSNRRDAFSQPSVSALIHDKEELGEPVPLATSRNNCVTTITINDWN